jgi:hypothetical protein
MEESTNFPAGLVLLLIVADFSVSSELPLPRTGDLKFEVSASQTPMLTVCFDNQKLQQHAFMPNMPED